MNQNNENINNNNNLNNDKTSKNERSKGKKLTYNGKSLKFKPNFSISPSPVRKKDKNELQSTTNILKKEINNPISENDIPDKISIIPIVLPRIDTPSIASLKGKNLSKNSVNNLRETANNFSEINNNNNMKSKNINRASMRVYR